MRNISEAIFFLCSLLGLLSLLVLIPVAMFLPARFTKPWKMVSLLSVFTFASAIDWLLLGRGC
jgi:hypothetical protein